MLLASNRQRGFSSLDKVRAWGWTGMLTFGLWGTLVKDLADGRRRERRMADSCRCVGLLSMPPPCALPSQAWAVRVAEKLGATFDRSQEGLSGASKPVSRPKGPDSQDAPA